MALNAIQYALHLIEFAQSELPVDLRYTIFFMAVSSN